MTRFRGGLTGAVAAVVLAYGLAACGGSDDPPQQLNLDVARERILDLANQEYSDNATIGAVRCPQRVAIKKDNNFFCTVDIGGQQLRIDVVQTDDQGSVKFAQGQAVLVPTKMVDAVTSYAASKGTPVSAVSCGQTPVLVVVPGKTVTCSVTFADGASGEATFRVDDTVGNTPLVGLERT